MTSFRISRCALAAIVVSAPAFAVAQSVASIESVIVTARLRSEDAQKVPVTLSVVDSVLLDHTDTDNLQQLARLVPSLGYVSPNPRNTAFTIRGLGSSVVAVSQANDGLEPGVGFYVDGVYHARPATAAFDYSDLARVEILRGPQGTLFGKNTTAGAINVVSQRPAYVPEFDAEFSRGEFNFTQAKVTAGGALVDGTLAGRVAALVTTRDGVLTNANSGQLQNDIDNASIRGQLLWDATTAMQWRLSADFTSIDTHCCTQVYVGVGTTLRSANRQYAALAAGKYYAPPSLNPYDRLTDIDAPLAVDTSEGGIALTGDWQLKAGTLTSISAWRFWNWNAANDRDYTDLVIQTRQGIPSRQDQYSQELRFASTPGRFEYVTGLYFFTQTITGRPVTIYGPDAAYWLLPGQNMPANLLDGFGTDGRTRFESDSSAVFGEATWHLNDAWALTAGLRYTAEDKHGEYDTFVFGGLATTVPAQLNAKLSILRPQSYRATVDDGSTSGRINLGYQLSDDVMLYAGYARGSKSGGINMSGLPLNAANQPVLALAAIEPEQNTTIEAGVKSAWLDQRLLLNAAVFHTEVEDFQANVVDSGPGALRGYLANVDEVRVDGAELELSAVLSERWSGRFSLNWTDGEYASYQNAPCPLELIGNSTSACDLSGRPLPATPELSASIGGEYHRKVQWFGSEGDAWARVDVTGRSSSYGDPADSRALLIAGYGLVNLNLGFQQETWQLNLWARNALNKNFMQNLTIQAGNAGLIVGTPGDPRMAGMTVRVKY
jgi:iron complex outermembrane receptor protein